MKNLLIPILIFIITSNIYSQNQAICEAILFIDENGISYKKYVDIQTLKEKEGFLIFHAYDKSKSPEEKYIYINPKEYKIIEQKNEPYNIMAFNSFDYSFIELGNLKDDGELKIVDGEFSFSNTDIKDSKGYHGFAWIGGIYKKFTYSWVFQPNFKILNYSCNKKGDWVIRNNTLSFYGEDINNIVFQVNYKKILNDKITVHNGRSVEIADSIVMNNYNAQIDVWDANKEDGDIISLSLNGNLICKDLRVKNEKSTFNIKFLQKNNILILHAENIGDVPPNTAAIEISDGKTRKKIILNSDMGKSEAIKIEIN